MCGFESHPYRQIYNNYSVGGNIVSELSISDARLLVVAPQLLEALEKSTFKLISTLQYAEIEMSGDEIMTIDSFIKNLPPGRERQSL